MRKVVAHYPIVSDNSLSNPRTTSSTVSVKDSAQRPEAEASVELDALSCRPLWKRQLLLRFFLALPAPVWQVPSAYWAYPWTVMYIHTVGSV